LGRGKLPTWVVRMRSRLRFTFFPPGDYLTAIVPKVLGPRAHR
jgi:hypothetical protein